MKESNVFFDPELLLEKLDRDEELARELLTAFAEDAPMRLDALTKAVSESNGASAAGVAHSLKGMCGVVRVQSLVNLAFSLERMGQSNDVAGMQTLLEEFRPMLDTVLTQVNDYLNP